MWTRSQAPNVKGWWQRTKNVRKGKLKRIARKLANYAKKTMIFSGS